METESVSSLRADDKLIAFVDLESAMRRIVASTRPVAENLPYILNIHRMPLVPFKRPSNYDQSPMVH